MRLGAALAAVLAASAPGPSDAAALACTAAIQRVSPPINACMGRQTVKISAVGDVLLHSPLQRRGYGAEDGFRGIWRAAEPFFRAADIAYANLEGPVAPGITRGFGRATDPGPVFDNRVYSSYPLFNYHPRVVGDLKASGITLVSTANNHALDRGSAGADLTIAALESHRMPYTGTIRAGAPRRFVAYTDTALGRIAWIACSYSTNGVPDPQDQVLMCYADRAELLTVTAREAARPDIGAVIVTPHWGYEYTHAPNANQKALAADLVAAGATAVIGTHPHVVQPWEFPVSPRGGRSLVIYSTGNFVSGQVSLPRRTGALAWIELCRQPPARDLAVSLGQRLVVAHAGWVALYMTRGAAGPELQVPEAGATGMPGAARQLLARYLPAGTVSAELACHTPAATGPVIALQ